MSTMPNTPMTDQVMEDLIAEVSLGLGFGGEKTKRADDALQLLADELRRLRAPAVGIDDSGRAHLTSGGGWGCMRQGLGSSADVLRLLDRLRALWPELLVSVYPLKVGDCVSEASYQGDLTIVYRDEAVRKDWQATPSHQRLRWADNPTSKGVLEIITARRPPLFLSVDADNPDEPVFDLVLEIVHELEAAHGLPPKDESPKPSRHPLAGPLNGHH